MPLMTVGHSSHDWPSFEALLDRHEVGLLIDVRSRPRSRLEHFCKPQLRWRLNSIGISYLQLGDELGGDGGSAPDYIVMARSRHFLRGIDRVLDLASRTRVVLTCAEGEPWECHRCILIGRHLAGVGEPVGHILRDGAVETHEAAEDRLLAALGRTEADLLATREARLSEAYAKQALRLQRGLRLPKPRALQASGRSDA